MKSLPRNVILDLVPLYLSGEASEETRKLVENFAQTDNEIAKMIEDPDTLPTLKEALRPSDKLEQKTINKLRKSIRRQMVMVAMGTLTLLMIPWVAMQFTTEVQWDGTDFIVMGIMLLVAGLSYIFISNLSGAKAYKAGVALSIITGFLLLWMNLAVGLIGSEDNPANLLFGIVLLIGIVGGILVRFRARSMARVLFVTAVAQFMVPFLAWLLRLPGIDNIAGFMGIILINTIFALLFAISGILFNKSENNAPL